MNEDFFKNPILNSPYEYPSRHWVLDEDGQPTGEIEESRRKSKFITPVPKPSKRKSGLGDQTEMVFDDLEGLNSETQEYNPTPIINEIRQFVNQWRKLPDQSQWLVTPETARILNHWRNGEAKGVRPFFCQIEAAETIIWLTEVAPKWGRQTQKFWKHLKGANAQANPELIRLALKLATGTGKTTVMAMLIAWQTVNAVRNPKLDEFSLGFLIVTPGITIRDRLRVLLPNVSENYYRAHNILPNDMLEDLDRARIVITNFHAFKKREKSNLSGGTKKLLSGWRQESMRTEETVGQMLHRVAQELTNMKKIVVINDEAHHCYREKVGSQSSNSFDELKREAKKEINNEKEAARIWINGLEAVKKVMGISAVYDLSATPFFLQGSGYAEGTLFPWTVSDFSLVDAIESGIVKFPRVPISDNISNEDMPMYRNLWEYVGKSLSKKPKKSDLSIDPHTLPVELSTALDALYGHYVETFNLWEKRGLDVPPVFIIVCNNTTTSERVYKYISGFESKTSDGQIIFKNGHMKLFQNYESDGTRLAKPRTILIDSVQLESGEALDDKFREIATEEIEQFKREIIQRTGDIGVADNIDDATLLREVMNTVGKKDKLGEQIRCVVSVSMLTEGWDASTVTHILGVRAFGTQLICEQVVGRGLRRQSYQLNDKNMLNVEYADILGIPFDFASKPVIAPPSQPEDSLDVFAVSPDRDDLEISFPRVEGYRMMLPPQQLKAEFKKEHVLVLTPKLVGASITKNKGLIGESVDLDLKHLDEIRTNTLIYNLTRHLLYYKYRDHGEAPKIALFGQLKRIVKQWLEFGGVQCKGETYPGMLMYSTIADIASEKIKSAIAESLGEDKYIQAILSPYSPTGSTSQVDFKTSVKTRWQTDANKCHINWAICDSEWEIEFCRIAESHPQVISYVRNFGLEFEIPYLLENKVRKYIPDFIVQISDGNDVKINVIVEVKGKPDEYSELKANTVRSFWVPSVNNLKKYGQWSFVEFTSFEGMHTDFYGFVEQVLGGR